LPQVIFGYARRGTNPSIYAAATLLIAVVSVGIIIYSVMMARQQRQRLRETNAAARSARESRLA
jgi:putrescine transport system permease protein